MTRSIKSQLTSLAGLTLVALAVFAPASAMAGGSKPHHKPIPHTPIVIHHGFHFHYHPGSHFGLGVYVGGGRFGINTGIVGSGGYVVSNPVVSPVVTPVVAPVVSPVVSPVVAPVLNPAPSQSLYTLFYTDSQGQTQAYGQYTATTYSNGATDWGGLLEARDQLTASGIQCWASPATATTIATASSTASSTASND